jgi:hypothetical protein
VNEIILTPLKRWGFLYLYNMKLLKVLESLILESRRIKLGSFEDDEGDIFNVIATIHSQENVNKNSVSATRVDSDSIGDVVLEYQDEISKISKSIEGDLKKDSIFVRDFTNRFDFILYPTYKNGKYELLIATSMNHPENLKVKPKNTLMIITNSGDTVIKEQLESNNFTKITRGDIIIYIL